MRFPRTRAFVSRYERHFSVLAMAAGFVLDNAALEEINGLPETLLLSFYFVSAGLLILAIHVADTRSLRWLAKARPYLPLAFQAVIGSWYSAFLVFYSHSASLSASWPFLAILFVIFAGTEIFRSYQDRLAFQNALYFFAIVTYAAAVVPLFTGSLGVRAFLLSGAAALAVFGAFFALLFVTGPARLKAAGKRVVLSVAAVFAVVNIFYFAHLLPPLPLTLRAVGVYHAIEKTAAGYAAIGESSSALPHFLGEDAVHIRAGGPVFVFSSVYTPVAVRTNLVHRWQEWDAALRRWVTRSVVSFPISGGRDAGYRGYSEIPGIAEGLWRVSVETPDGALIGRISFSVRYVSAPPPLLESVL